jgi:K+/H+ antiporter YhaU regulatory subunit KhtT
VSVLTEDEMKAEIAYLEKRHREECSMLIAERDSWKARYDEILNCLSQQVQEKKIELVFSESQSKQIAKMLSIR